MPLATTKIRASDQLVNEMLRMSIKHVFGIPGGQIMPLFDAFYEKEIDTILFRQELGAIHAAEAYGRLTKKPGVTLVTSGPGATNLATGLANAYMDSAPLVAITGQVPTTFLGRDAFQETDSVGFAMPLTKHTFMVKEPSGLTPVFKAAYRIAVDGRAGPVLIDVPRDVQIGNVDQGYCPEPTLSLKIIPEPDPNMVVAIVNLLLKAERPVILAGGGVCWSGATQEVLALAETLGIPIVTTFPGKNCVPTNHPLVMGPAGMHGRVEGDAALINADVVFAVGTRFSDRTIGNFAEFQKGRKIIHVDIDKSEIGKNVKPSLAVVGDIKAVIRMMLQIIPDALIAKKNQEPYIKWLKQIKRVFDEYRERVAAEFPGFAPWKVLKVIREAVPPQTITTTGVGSHQMWCELHWDVYVPGTFITSAGLGTMGFGLPAALGAKTAQRNTPVVNIDGDGSFQMNMPNLALINEYDLPIINVVFNNSALMLVRHWQVMQYNNRIIATEFNANPDFTKIAEAYGIDSIRPSSYEELSKSVSRAVRNNGSLLIDVTIDKQKDFVLPFVPSGKWLKEVILPEGFRADLDYKCD